MLPAKTICLFNDASFWSTACRVQIHLSLHPCSSFLPDSNYCNQVESFSSLLSSGKVSEKQNILNFRLNILWSSLKSIKFFLRLLILRYNSENVSGDSNFEKLGLTSEGEKYSALREGILSRKKLTSGSWLRSEKCLLFKNGIKLIDLKFSSGLILIQLNLNVAFSKWYQFLCKIPCLHNSNAYHNVLLSTTIYTAPSFPYWNLHW